MLGTNKLFPLLTLRRLDSLSYVKVALKLPKTCVYWKNYAESGVLQEIPNRIV